MLTAEATRRADKLTTRQGHNPRMIYYDKTESRENTRLPDAVLQAGQSVTGLEAATGADLLISTLSKPGLPDKLTDSRPHQLALRKHLDAGALVQRKSGGDFVNSIPNLSGILQRMKATRCEQAWLYIDADLHKSKDGAKCVVDGRVTGWDWHAVMGAKLAWQLHGGYLFESTDPHDMITWVKLISDWLIESRENPVKRVSVRMPAQVLTGPDWRSILCALPGIGPDTAEDIADYCGSLGNALTMLSDPEQASVIAGVGKGRIQAVRRVMGLPDGVILSLSTTEADE